LDFAPFISLSRAHRVHREGQGRWGVQGKTGFNQREKVRGLKAQGMGPTEIAKVLKIGRASVYRALKADL
jgi:DNA invertase Pin-like site-specific DNA recombinase